MGNKSARKRRRIGLHSGRRGPFLEAFHEICWHSRQLSTRSVRCLGEAQLGQQAFADRPEAVFTRALVGAAGGADDVSGGRLLGTGQVGGRGRQPDGEQQQARGPGPRPARRAQRTRGAAERERRGRHGGASERCAAAGGACYTADDTRVATRTTHTPRSPAARPLPPTARCAPPLFRFVTYCSCRASWKWKHAAFPPAFLFLLNTRSVIPSWKFNQFMSHFYTKINMAHTNNIFQFICEIKPLIILFLFSTMLSVYYIDFRKFFITRVEN